MKCNKTTTSVFILLQTSDLLPVFKVHAQQIWKWQQEEQHTDMQTGKAKNKCEQNIQHTTTINTLLVLYSD